jgi:hypothetical protein
MAGTEPAGRQNVQAEIEYDVVALGLTAAEVVAIIKDATGVTVDPKATNFLNDLDTAQLEATRRRLSDHTGWRPPRLGF